VVLQKNDHLVDSLAKSALPFATLTVNDRNDQQFVCDFFHKQPIQSKNEQYGVNYKYDPDRLFIRYNNGKDYGVAQFYVFGKILQTYRYFTKDK
jgi:membrane-bound inhibitor of C-type lysozyme